MIISIQEALKQFQKEAIWIKEFNIAKQRRFDNYKILNWMWQGPIQKKEDFGKFQTEQVIWIKGLRRKFKLVNHPLTQQ